MRPNLLSLLLLTFALALLLGCTGTASAPEGAAQDAPRAGADANAATGAATPLCSVSDPDCTEINLPNLHPAIDKVEVIHFHGTNQCYSCITVGDYAEETINTYFADELKSGKITFSHVNRELPENQGLVNKYGVTSASLWIGVYDGSGFHKEQNVNVWYKIENKEAYMAYLKGILEKRLNGEFD